MKSTMPDTGGWKRKKKKTHKAGLGIIITFKKDDDEEGDTYESLNKTEGRERWF